MVEFPHGVSQAWRRLWLCIRHPLNVNPESPYERRGWVDLAHAYSNLWVEIARAQPHWFGRAIAWSTPIWIVIVAILLLK